MRRARSRAGVTLVELLAAITLVSLLSVGILYAMRTALVTLERTNDKLLANRRVLGAQRILDQQVSNMISVRAICGGPRDEYGIGGVQFFHGEQFQMRFVSRYSVQLAGRGGPMVLEFAVIPGENGRGVRLIVNELPYGGPSTVEPLCVGYDMDSNGSMNGKFPPVQARQGSFVVADKLAYCRLSYQVFQPVDGQKRWSPRFGGYLPPSAIRVEMAPLEPDSSRLQMTSTTIPVRIFRNSRVNYVDLDEKPQIYQ